MDRLPTTFAKIRADTHVHFYDCFDLYKLIDIAAEHLIDAPETLGLICLTERAGQNVFTKIQRSTLVKRKNENLLLLLDSKWRGALGVLAGRQIATSERLEVLGLGCVKEISDGIPVIDAINEVRKQNALPVLPWSPGKWTGARKKLIIDLVQNKSDLGFVLGDISMRASGLCEPSIFKLAREKNIAIIAGTDPLPIVNEEQLVGTYGCEFGSWDSSKALPIFDRTALINSKMIGSRNNLIKATARWCRNSIS